MIRDLEHLPAVPALAEPRLQPQEVEGSGEARESDTHAKVNALDSRGGGHHVFVLPHPRRKRGRPMINNPGPDALRMRKVYEKRRRENRQNARRAREQSVLKRRIFGVRTAVELIGKREMRAAELVFWARRGFLSHEIPGVGSAGIMGSAEDYAIECGL